MTRALSALLACVGRRPGLPDAEIFAGFTDQDWQDLVERAAEHRLTACLYGRLRASALHRLVPEAVLDAIKDVAVGVAIRNLQLHADLRVLCGSLHRENIPVIVLKGAHLDAAVFEGIGRREMIDLDLLVRRVDLERAITTVQSLGFAARRAIDLPVALSAHHHVPPMKRGESVVEIHWMLAPPPHRSSAVEMSWIWQDALSLKTAEPALVLSDADLIVHLCQHCAGVDGYRLGLRALVDITQIAHVKQVDWREVDRKASLWQCSRAVRMTLLLSRTLLGAAIPPADSSLSIFQPCDATLVEIARDEVLNLDRAGISSNAVQLAGPGNWWRRVRAAADGPLRRAHIARRYAVALDSPQIPWLRLRLGLDVLVRYGLRVAPLLFDRERRTAIRRRALLKDWLDARLS